MANHLVVYLQAANGSVPLAAFTLTSFPGADGVSSIGELSLPETPRVR